MKNIYTQLTDKEKSLTGLVLATVAVLLLRNQEALRCFRTAASSPELSEEG
jgi:hypothetical protein